MRPAPDRPVYGFLVAPSGEDGTSGCAPRAAPRATPRWCAARGSPPTSGYSLTLGIALPEWSARPGEEIGFDLLVNRVEDGRQRRSGQLVWSGGGGWVYLRGDRQDPAGPRRRSSCAEWIGSPASPRPAASVPAALFGAAGESLPLRMTRSSGCRVWDSEGREYLDYIMGLGAVALGYGHPEVTRAVAEAAELGVVGPLPPVLEEALAADLCRAIPWLERVRFLKTGAEAMAAAVRLARVVTGRDAVLGCGYHGWLDWCQTAEGRGVPAATRALYAELPFNDPERTQQLIRAAGDRLAAVVFEPVILEPPEPGVARRAPRGDASRRARCSSPTRSRPSAAWRSGAAASATASGPTSW